MMTIAPVDSSWIAVIALETAMLAGLAWVAVHQLRTGVNGPCRLCLCLLLAWRLSVLVSLGCAPPCWDYLWGALFGFAFLYATHHLAILVCRFRRTGMGCDARG